MPLTLDVSCGLLSEALPARFEKGILSPHHLVLFATLSIGYILVSIHGGGVPQTIPSLLERRSREFKMRRRV